MKKSRCPAGDVREHSLLRKEFSVFAAISDAETTSSARIGADESLIARGAKEEVSSDVLRDLSVGAARLGLEAIRTVM